MPQITGIVTDNDTTKTIDFIGTVTNKKQTFYFDERQDGMTIKNEDSVTLTLIVNSRSYQLSANASLTLDERVISFNIVRGATGKSQFSLSSYVFHSRKTDVEDVLTSTNTKSSLSANQGRVLKGLIDTNTTDIATNTAQIADITTYAYVESFKKQGNETDDTARIQRAIDSLKTNGGLIQFANKTYNISSPLKVYSNMTLRGVDRAKTQIISQGDIPIIANEGYFTPGVGGSEIKIEYLGLYPRGVTSKTKYAIELVNTYNCSVKECYINANALTTSDVEGIRFSKDTTYTGSHFVNAVRKCQLQNASIVMQSTDSYIESCEVWGYSRPFAIHLIKSSQFVSDCQIVGSPVNGGIYIKDIVDNFNIELVRIDNVYFDGSYDNIDSGLGINAFNLVNSHISNCDFWRQMDEGIKITSGFSNVISSSIFKNNNRRDVSKNDIYMDSVSCTTITANTFIRDISHVNKGRAIQTVNSPDTHNVITGNTVFNTANYIVPVNLSNRDLLVNNSGMSEKKRYTGTTPPASGSWAIGDIFYNSAPVASGKIGWVCTSSGSPGTWKAFGVIDA